MGLAQRYPGSIWLDGVLSSRYFSLGHYWRYGESSGGCCEAWRSLTAGVRLVQTLIIGDELTWLRALICPCLCFFVIVV